MSGYDEIAGLVGSIISVALTGGASSYRFIRGWSVEVCFGIPRLA